jgi:hypothetical protein
MPEPSSLGRQIEAALSSVYATDKAGHSQYLLRYRTSTGIPFAVNRTPKGSTRIWLPAVERLKVALEQHGFACHLSEPRSDSEHGTGRNSNLDAVPEFKGKPVLWISVNTPGRAVEAASCLR